MKELWRKWDSISLIKRIVVGLVIGAILGITCGTVPGLSDVLTLLGTLFTSALKAIAPILVFFLVISALANAKTSGSMSTIVVLYIISTFLAALVAVIASFIFPIEMTLVVDPSVEQASPEGIGEVLSSLVASIVANPVDALVNANYLGILAWAVMLGVALRAAKAATKDVFHNVADAIGQVVHWIISLAPFGIMGLVFTAVSTNGIEIFTEYGQLLLVLVGCMLFIAFVVNPALVWANMTLCRKLGLDEDNYSVSIPLGATINMAGASVTISVMTMTACHTLGIAVDIPTAVILSVLAAVSACGASGVAGGSLLLIPLACSLFGISNDVAMQVVGVGFIIGVIQDSCETALNSSSDVLLTATAEYRARRIAGQEVSFADWEK